MIESAETGKELFAGDLQGIDATIRRLEEQVTQIKAYLKSEEDALRHSQAILHAFSLQAAHIDRLANHLASHHVAHVSLSSAERSTSPPLRERSVNITKMAPKKGHRREQGSTKGEAEPTSSARASRAPRRFVTMEEFGSVSTYMRGRLTADKVNAALDELASRAESNAALVSAARKGRSLGSERKHAQWLAYRVANHELLRGQQWWVMDGDLRGGKALRMDNTGRMILTLLRHVGRLSEARIGIDGVTHLVYMLV